MIYLVKGQNTRVLVLCALILSSNVQYELYYIMQQFWTVLWILDDLPSSNEINDHPMVNISEVDIGTHN
jgi:hypothetical protein